MKNYIIEGNIDFFSELYKSLDEKDDDNNNNLCLITNQPLSENFVEMNCGHKFNYTPLYNDVLNHKKKFNHMESHHDILKKNEIRCPYCRSKQKKLLPYYESMGPSMKVTGVNAMPDPPPGYEIGTCCYYTSEIDHHNCSNNVMLLDLDNKTYCTSHYSLVNYQLKKAAIKKAKDDAKKKAKEEAKKASDEAKQKAKEEKQKAKEEAKQKAKEEKQKAKPSTPKKKVKLESNSETNTGPEPITKTISILENENTIVSSSTCSQMVKSGPNKGHQCKCKVYMSLLCKRHYSALTPTNIGPLEIK
jgi:DNA polymerase III alpha subunit (gram-positive type)